MSLQFPPSSPVLDGPEPEYVPFKGKELPRGRYEYPTPNPSSTMGRSSSPARQDKEMENSEKNTHYSDNQVLVNDHSSDSRLAVKTVNSPVASSPSRTSENHKTVSINKDFNIVNPHASVLRIPLLADRNSVTIGRSSKTCDFHFKNMGSSADKRISRCHVKVEYSANEVVFTCLGFNGFGIIIPRVCLVTKIADSSYSLSETDRPLPMNNISKSVSLDYHHTEFHVSRGESVQMPRFANVLLQIGSHVLLVNPDDCDEEVTDEESEVEPVPKEASSKAETPAKKNIAHISINRPSKSVLTPVMSQTSQPHTPKKIAREFAPEEATPSKPHKPSSEKENSIISEMSMKKATTPLAVRSPNLPESVVPKRRAQSEEPQGSFKKPKKMPVHDANGKLIIDERCLDGLQNIGEIENILINHLAFSRLSSTPASFLNTISAVVSKLSLQQLRVVLHKIMCIGVIYRQGKDAAGKPLEEEYYYIPEKDRDAERNKLVSSIRGHGGLRACRKTHKQYYWKKPAPIKK